MWTVENASFGKELILYQMTKAFVDYKINENEKFRPISGLEENIVSSICHFSHNVFNRLLSQGHQKLALFGKGLKKI